MVESSLWAPPTDPVMAASTTRHPVQAAIFSLCTVAIGQPALDLIARYPAFLTAHHTGWYDIALLLATPTVLIPSVLIVMQNLLSRIHRASGDCFGLLIIALLSALIVLRWNHDLQWLNSAGNLTLAVLVGAASSALYATRAWYRSALRALLISLLVVPAAFLFTPGVLDLLRHAQPRAHPGVPANTPPVVLLVFDEFNSGALLTPEGKIDAARFPNFARLASFSSWYRAATAVSTETYTAIPALLSGRFPHGPVAPTASQYPDNLFSLLAPHYALKVHETVTRLCNGQGCGVTRSHFGLGDSLGLLWDSGIIYAHLVWPRALRQGLPSITRQWASFGARNALQARVRFALKEDQAATFRAFVQEIGESSVPTLYYYHALLPHAPYHFLPSGMRYALDDGYAGIRFGNRWSTAVDQVAMARRRYLWQLGFVDRLLGELLDRMQATGILDRAMLVVSADHGVSFRPGNWRRSLSPGNLDDILRVPLLIKWPGQAQSEISYFPAQSTDILPSITAALALDPGMHMDGVSLHSRPLPVRREITVFPRAEVKLTLPPTALHSTPTCTPAINLDPHQEASGHWIDRVPGPALRASAKTIAVHILHAERYRHVDPASGFLPLQILGSVRRLDPRTRNAPLTLEIAVNGRIRTTAPAHPADRKREHFMALLPPDSLHAGTNRIEVFARFGAPRKKPRTSGTPYRLDEYSPTIVAADGQRFTLDQGPEAGWIDGIDLSGSVPTLTGWARTPRGPTAEVIAFSGAHYIGRARTGLPRSDVAAVTSDATLAHSGIALPVSVSDLNACLRVFVLSSAGTAAELAMVPDVLLQGVLAQQVHTSGAQAP